MNRRLTVFAALFGLVVCSLRGAAQKTASQQAQAKLDAKDTCGYKADRSNFDKQPGGFTDSYHGGDVVITCPERHMVLWADSAVNYGAQHRWYFQGHVRFTDPRVDLHSAFLNYFEIGDSVKAVGAVHVVDSTGSTLDGPVVSYYQASPRVRPRAQVRATQNPILVIAQKDSLGHPDSSITIKALTLFRDGDSDVYASRCGAELNPAACGSLPQVLINRASVHSVSDSAYLDLAREVTHLIGHPVVSGVGAAPGAAASPGGAPAAAGNRPVGDSVPGRAGRVVPNVGDSAVRGVGNPVTGASVSPVAGRPFELRGTLIDAYSPHKKLNRVIARGAATATSQDLQLTADTLDLTIAGDHLTRAVARLNAVATYQDFRVSSDTIDLRINNDQLERTIAWNRKGQAKATSSTQTITADSIDVLMPHQQILRMDAVRNAYASGEPDPAHMKTTERDLMWGDTIIAHFDTVATNDTVRTPPIRQIVAVSGSARPQSADTMRAKAYYHVATSDTADRRPAINYVQARHRITIDFIQREVSFVTIVGPVSGFYVPPLDTVKAAVPPPAGKKPPPATPPKPPRRNELPPVTIYDDPLDIPRARHD